MTVLFTSPVSRTEREQSARLRYGSRRAGGSGGGEFRTQKRSASFPSRPHRRSTRSEPSGVSDKPGWRARNSAKATSGDPSGGSSTSSTKVQSWSCSSGSISTTLTPARSRHARKRHFKCYRANPASSMNAHPRAPVKTAASRYVATERNGLGTMPTLAASSAERGASRYLTTPTTMAPAPTAPKSKRWMRFME